MTAKDGKPCKKCGTSAWYKSGRCTQCAKEAARNHHQANQAERKEQSKRWREAHPDYHKQHRDANAEHYRQYRQAHSRKYTEAAKQWAVNNPERARIAVARSQAKNKPKILARAKAYRDGNKEKVYESIRRWRQQNPVKSTEYSHRRRAKKQANGGTFTPAEWEALCKQYDNKCLCCGRDDKPLTFDHVIPIVLGGSNDIENIQPLCGSCNSSKGAKSIDYRTKPGLLRWLQKKLF